MSITEKLLSLDVAKYKEKAIDTLEIKRLSQIVGEPFLVRIQEVDDERVQELQAMMLDKKGRVDYTQTRKVNALLCTEGVTEPNLKDTKLQKHFGANTPKELAEILFKGADLGKVADAIIKLNNFVDDSEDEDDTKN
ncbi:MAG TPA: hypothetical protein DCE48_01785 [Lachnospiraceae bacterium]|nr:hypothetical protein [Lachnospiraceae bacterium]